MATSEGHDRIDAAIDDVARRQTMGTPGAAFTARVLARLDGRPTQRVWWRPRWTWPPLAVAAVVVLLMIVRTAWKTPAPIPQPAPQVAAVAAPPRAVDPQPAIDAPQSTAKVHRPSIAGRRLPATPSAIDAMAPERLAVSSIALDSLTTAESMALSEMTVPAIELQPLSRDFGSRN